MTMLLSHGDIMVSVGMTSCKLDFLSFGKKALKLQAAQ
jgi:hypothetical protein